MKKYFSEIVLLTKSYNLIDFKDWLRWHLDIIGFDHIMIFDNESEIDIKTECEKYKDKITYEKINGIAWQYKLYDDYINNKSKSQWVIPIDDDEFIFIKNGNKINTFLKNLIDENKIKNKFSIGWLNLFPSIKKDKRDDKLSIVQESIAFSHEATLCWQQGDLPVKTFVNTDYKYNYQNTRYRHNPQCIDTNENSITIRGEEINSNWQKNNTNSYDKILLCHYQFKTVSEWERKCKLGSPGGSITFNKLKTNAIDKINKLYENNNFNTFTNIKDILYP